MRIMYPYLLMILNRLDLDDDALTHQAADFCWPFTAIGTRLHPL